MHERFDFGFTIDSPNPRGHLHSGTVVENTEAGGTLVDRREIGAASLQSRAGIEFAPPHLEVAPGRRALKVIPQGKPCAHVRKELLDGPNRGITRCEHDIAPLTA